MLRERSLDGTYFHNEFLRSCLKAKVRVPDDVAIDLLEWKINEGLKEGKKWSLVWGFPETMDQLVAFKRKVSISCMLAKRSLLTLIGTKVKLHVVSELHIRGNAGRISG